MHLGIRRALPAIAAVLLVPASASATTKPVLMGTPPSASKKFEQKYQSDIDAFFPAQITVAVGDSIKFMPVGFHNVDLPGKGAKRSPLMVPGETISGANDAAGAAYWFNGQRNIGFNPALVSKSLFGKTAKYTGATRVNTGLPLSDKPKPAVIKFTKAGTYTYFCDVHAGMKGTVKVLRRGKRAPSAKADAKRVAKQLAAAEKSAKALAAKKSASTDAIEVGPQGAGGVARFAFLPDTLSVAVGSTVTFKMPASSREVHTASAGPGDPIREENSFLGKLASSFNSPTFDPVAVYSSEAPGTVGDLSPASHGNGFWNSGVIDADSSTPLPATSSVRFTQAGTYKFYCLIHPFMVATVTAG